MTNYKFTLVSNQDTPPALVLTNGWQVLFYPLGQETFASLNVHLDQGGGWFTQANGIDGSTGDFYQLTGYFNNYGGWPISYVVDFDRLPGPSVDLSLGKAFYGPSRNSSLLFGNKAGFLQGSYPTSFTINTAQTATPYTVSITPGTQAYSKSDPHFTIPYGIYNCPGQWSIKSERAVCSLAATYRYSYNNNGILAVAGTETQQLATYTNTGYCAAMDGAGTVTVFTDNSGTISVTTLNEGTDTAALAYVAQQYGSALPNGAQGFMSINVTQTYYDWLQLTKANDGIFDWSTLPQEDQVRTTWAGLSVSSSMSTQALYTINAS